MSLRGISLASTAIYVFGLLLFLAYAMFSFREFRQQQGDLKTTQALQQQINAFSAASDSLLLYPPDPELWQAYLAEGQRLARELRQLSVMFPDAGKAADGITRMLETMQQFGVSNAFAESTNAAVAMPERSRLILNNLAMTGMVLDTALADALAERADSFEAVLSELLVQLAIIGLLFGLLNMVAIGLIHRHVTWPVLSLSRTFQALRNGDRQARTDISGDGELATLGRSFNELIEHLQQRERQLQTLHEQYERAEVLGRLCSWDVDYGSGQFSVSPNFDKIFGLDGAAVEDRERAMLQQVSDDDRSRYSRRRRDWLKNPSSYFAEEFCITGSDGQLRWLREKATHVHGTDGHADYAVGTVQDITDWKLQSRETAHTLALRKALFNALPAHIALVNNEGVIIEVNDQWRRFGRENEYQGEGFGIGTNYLEICAAASGECAAEAAEVAAGLRDVLSNKRDVFVKEYPCHSPDQQRWFRVMGTRLQATAELPEAGAVVMHVDVTERMLTEIQLEQLALYDPLTKILNRQGFDRQLSMLLESSWQEKAMLVLLDIRDLREINEAFGYEAGDTVLMEVGRRLTELEYPGATVCRVGGDEFALFMPALPDSESESDVRLTLISEVFAANFDVEQNTIKIKCRCGSVVLGGTRRSIDTLVSEAELALFRGLNAEDDGNIAWSRYTARFAAERRVRDSLLTELTNAAQSGAFELHYQPKVDLGSGKLIAGEALLRWPHPVMGLQSPAIFIPLAEQSQLIKPIGNWVINEACRRLRSWQDAGLDIVRIAVNVSLQQFIFGDLPEVVEAALRENSLAPAALSLEVTESVFAGESDNLHRQLHRLREMGVRLSLDDFGTGYSSLLYLQRYPFDEIKIDRAFVANSIKSGYCRQAVKSVIDLAESLGAEVVAEGIESVEVAQLLLELGCSVGQGYYFSLPLESEDFGWLLANHVELPLRLQ